MTDYSTAASTVKTALDAAYQEKLESGTNIKTINNLSLLGSGNISIGGGGGGGGGTVVEINDDCTSSSKLSDYGSSIRLTDGQTSTCSLSYDTNNNCYDLSGSGNNISAITLDALDGLDKVTVRVKFKLGGTSNYYQCILAVAPSKSNNTAFEGIRQMNGSFQNFYDGGGGGGNESTKGSVSNIASQWHYLELEKDGTTLTGSVYDSTLSLLSTFTKTISSNYKYYLLGMNTERGYTTYIGEIYAEYEDDSGGGGGSVTIVTSWDSTPSDDVVPSEKLVKDTLDTKIGTSSTTGLLKNDGSVMTSGTGSSNWAVGNHSHSGMLTSSDIADNLTTNDATKVLSAKQGKALNDLIGQAISYINQ